jgi:hypothetical protein
MKHRADAYCPACGGTCRDARTIAALGDKPVLSLRPSFTGSGAPTFKPARKSGRFE